MLKQLCICLTRFGDVIVNSEYVFDYFSNPFKCSEKKIFRDDKVLHLISNLNSLEKNEKYFVVSLTEMS